MDCRECTLLADQAVIASEELQKICDRILAEFGDGRNAPALTMHLEAAERTLEKCVAALERHTKSHQLRGFKMVG